ncbi:MAG TPA: NifB/NifX family molybdenum-iron cluster-binding protein [Methanoregula sp.]|nr:NifB/NifX family molybdenum-iron cluster-binding protein [Methanoregula sp.]
MMKICITARGKTLDSAFECHFARAPFFIFHDSSTGKTEAVRNGFVISDTRIGQNAVRLLKTNGLDAVITGEIGENARALLKGSEISLHLFNGPGTVRQAIDAILRSRAEEVPGGAGYPH